MIDFAKWVKLTQAERSAYSKYVSETAAFQELGRRIGYLISVEKLEEAATIATFTQIIRSLMDAKGLSFEEAIDRIWTEHKEIIDRMPVPLHDETEVYASINRGKRLLEDLLS